jgi:hypothetical protein
MSNTYTILVYDEFGNFTKTNLRIIDYVKNNMDEGYA